MDIENKRSFNVIPKNRGLLVNSSYVMFNLHRILSPKSCLRRTSWHFSHYKRHYIRKHVNQYNLDMYGYRTFILVAHE